MSGDSTVGEANETQRRIDQYEDLCDRGALPAGHTYGFYEDESEFTHYCECGKWLEPSYYEMWDHINSVLKGGAA